jgi:hypothetical protein
MRTIAATHTTTISARISQGGSRRPNRTDDPDHPNVRITSNAWGVDRRWT